MQEDPSNRDAQSGDVPVGLEDYFERETLRLVPLAHSPLALTILVKIDGQS